MHDTECPSRIIFFPVERKIKINKFMCCDERFRVGSDKESNTKTIASEHVAFSDTTARSPVSAAKAQIKRLGKHQCRGWATSRRKNPCRNEKRAIIMLVYGTFTYTGSSRYVNCFRATFCIFSLGLVCIAGNLFTVGKHYGCCNIFCFESMK